MEFNDTMKQIPINGFDGYYVDINGVVYSRRCGHPGFFLKNNKVKILKPFKNNQNYLIIKLHELNNKTKSFLIHRLVIITFVGYSQDKNKTQVNHKNGNRNDNRLSNLEWSTPSENVVDEINRSNNQRGKLTKEQVIEIKKRINNKEKISKIARDFNVSKCTIGDIFHGRSWANI